MICEANFLSYSVCVFTTQQIVTQLVLRFHMCGVLVRR